MSTTSNPFHLIKTFPQLVKYLRDELDWPIESENFEDLTFDYAAEELGLDAATAVKIKEIKQLRPLTNKQPWGIFFVNFAPKQLPVVALRRILSSLVIKKRQSANKSQQAAWHLHDLLFISSYGETEHRDITFAHFAEEQGTGDLPTLRLLAWDDEDTKLKLDFVERELRSKLRWPEDDDNIAAWRTKWSEAFRLRAREVIKTSQQLAIRLADLARGIRKRANNVLAVESAKGPLRKMHAAFKEALIHDLTTDDFADMYAQTIAYGLLTARISRPAGLVADNLSDMVPVTNPFLKDLLETFLTIGGRKGMIDFDELGINDVVQLLRDTDMEAVLRDFGDRNPQEDPVIHFYELFLKEYDAKKRMQRGVFYTPRPVVSYIVNSVHEFLRSEFGLHDGLADSTTWAEMAGRNENLAIPEGVSPDEPFVQILDPATGTGTFLVETIDVIHKTMERRWEKQGHMALEFQNLWNEYVPKHLLPRLHGFELLMAPYAIAHMKVGLKLYETGYRFRSNERARVYLTNSLEPANNDKGQMGFAGWVPALAHEAQAVNAVKQNHHFTVVIGNPPYSRSSANKGEFADGLIEPYKKGVRDEKNIQPLSDDYIKFIAFCQQLLSSSGIGVFGMITNNTFLSGRIHRGMRECLLNSNSIVRVLDLHGSGNVDFLGSTGDHDANVFDIQQGVSISLFVRGTLNKRVEHAELVGRRQAKYDSLLARTTPFSELNPKSPYYLLVPWDAAGAELFQQYPSITEIFPFQSVSGKPGDDALLVSFAEDEVIPKLKSFRSSLERSKSIKLTEAGRNLAALSPGRPFQQKAVVPYAYRPFDTRYTYYDPAIWTRAVEHLKACVDGSAILLTTKIVKDPSFCHVFVTKLFADVIFLSNTSSVNCYSFPRKCPTGMLNVEHRTDNLDASVLKRLTGKIVSREQTLHYIYAILHSPEYRRRYSNALQLDFPRIPFTRNDALFQRIVKLGGELVGLHLLESPKLVEAISDYVGPKNPEIGRVSYTRHTVWLDKEETCGFKGVPEAVWGIQIGGYQVCEKWLKDRKGRKLSKDDIAHYNKIVVALSETIRLMKKIDEVIDEHGGWPDAFASGQRTVDLDVQVQEGP